MGVCKRLLEQNEEAWQEFASSLLQCLSALNRMVVSHTGVGVAAGAELGREDVFVKGVMDISKTFEIVRESNLNSGNTSCTMHTVLIKSFRCLRSQECRPWQ